MKKWIGICLLILLVIGGLIYYIIQPILPELTIQVMLEKLEPSNDTPILQSEDIDLTDEQRELIGVMLDSFSYEIIGSQIEGNQAFVSMDVTFIDVKQLIYDQRAMIIQLTMENVWEVLQDVLNNRTEQRLMITVLTLLNDSSLPKPMLSKRIEVPLRKERFYWVPQLSEDWFKSVFEVDQLDLVLP